MGGIASRRCDACREVAMISDRGVVKTVGATRTMGTDRDGTDRAICTCGTLVEWPRTLNADVAAEERLLADANPARLAICAIEGHDPLSNVVPPVRGGRIVTAQHICRRCGLFYAIEQRV